MGIISTLQNIGRNVAALGGQAMEPKRVVIKSQPVQRFIDDEGESAQQLINESGGYRIMPAKRPRIIVLNTDKTKSAQQLIQTVGQKQKAIQAIADYNRKVTIRRGKGNINYVRKKFGIIQRKLGKKGGAVYTAAGIKYHATSSRGVSHRTPGRPRLSFKPRVDPVTGRYIRVPANIYYKRQRLARRLYSAKYQQQQMQKAQYYQQRGISPQQAAQIEMIRQQKRIQQIAYSPQKILSPQSITPQRIQQYSQQQIQTSPYTVSADFFRGGKQVRPKEAWLR